MILNGNRLVKHKGVAACLNSSKIEKLGNVALCYLSYKGRLANFSVEIVICSEFYKSFRC